MVLPGPTQRHDTVLVGRIPGEQGVELVAVNVHLTEPDHRTNGTVEQYLVAERLIVPVATGWEALERPVVWSDCSLKPQLVAKTTRMVGFEQRGRVITLSPLGATVQPDEDQNILREAVLDVSEAYSPGVSLGSMQFRWFSALVFVLLTILCVAACVAAVLLDGVNP